MNNYDTMVPRSNHRGEPYRTIWGICPEMLGEDCMNMHHSEAVVLQLPRELVFFSVAALNEYEGLMKAKGVQRVRLGVINGNERSLMFWVNRGFDFYEEKQGDQWTVLCFEKELRPRP